MPETRGRTLEDIDASFRKRGRKNTHTHAHTRGEESIELGVVVCDLEDGGEMPLDGGAGVNGGLGTVTAPAPAFGFDKERRRNTVTIPVD